MRSGKGRISFAHKPPGTDFPSMKHNEGGATNHFFPIKIIFYKNAPTKGM